MRTSSPGVLPLAAVGICSIVLLFGSPPHTSAASVTASPSPAVAGIAGRVHDYPGDPVNSPRCRRLLRKIEKARDAENYDRLNRLARRYNRTCRVK